MPTSVYIFLVGSILAFLPAYFDHGDTWRELRDTEQKRRKRGLFVKLCALWAIPILGLVGTAFLAWESIRSDALDKQRDVEYQQVTDRLTQTESKYSEATNDLATAKRMVTPKPIKERIIECLNSINPNIVKKLSYTSRTRPLHLELEVEQYKLDELEHLSEDQEARGFIILNPEGNLVQIQSPQGGKMLTGVSLDINPELLK